MSINRADSNWPESEVTEIKTCNTCCRIPSAPFRVYDSRGKVVEGCVDACHTGHLVTPSESSYWHNRPEAKRIRTSLAKFSR